jgi:hypothetical protein
LVLRTAILIGEPGRFAAQIAIFAAVDKKDSLSQLPSRR